MTTSSRVAGENEPTTGKCRAASRTRSCGGWNQICGLYDVKPEKFGLVNNQVRFATYYGERIQRYTGVDVAAIARLSHGIVLQGGTSTGRTRNATCFVVNSPGEMRFCDDVPPYQTQLKFFAVYPLPWWGLRT